MVLNWFGSRNLRKIAGIADRDIKSTFKIERQAIAEINFMGDE